MIHSVSELLCKRCPKINSCTSNDQNKRGILQESVLCLDENKIDIVT